LRPHAGCGRPPQAWPRSATRVRGGWCGDGTPARPGGRPREKALRFRLRCCRSARRGHNRIIHPVLRYAITGAHVDPGAVCACAVSALGHQLKHTSPSTPEAQQQSECACRGDAHNTACRQRATSASPDSGDYHTPSSEPSRSVMSFARQHADGLLAVTTVVDASTVRARRPGCRAARTSSSSRPSSSSPSP
jgi:hypothetical protein